MLSINIHGSGMCPEVRCTEAMYLVLLKGLALKVVNLSSALRKWSRNFFRIPSWDMRPFLLVNALGFLVWLLIACFLANGRSKCQAIQSGNKKSLLGRLTVS